MYIFTHSYTQSEPIIVISRRCFIKRFVVKKKKMPLTSLGATVNTHPAATSELTLLAGNYMTDSRLSQSAWSTSRHGLFSRPIKYTVGGFWMTSIQNEEQTIQFFLAAAPETCVVSMPLKTTFLFHIYSDNIRTFYLNYSRHRIKARGLK